MIELSGPEIVASCVTLIGCIAFLFKRLDASQEARQAEMADRHEVIETKLADCESSHKSTSRELLDISRDMGRLEAQVGQLTGMEKLAEKVRKDVADLAGLHDEHLDEIAKK